jgi:hypothetical protein
LPSSSVSLLSASLSCSFCSSSTVWSAGACNPGYGQFVGSLQLFIFSSFFFLSLSNRRSFALRLPTPATFPGRSS